MTGTARVFTARARRTPPRWYRKPPVHEVILSLGFGAPVPRAALEALPKALGDQFPQHDRQDRVEVGMTIGPGGNQVMNSAREFDGWQFRDPALTRVISTGRSHLNVHAVRPGQWPIGEYPGWSAIYREALQLFEKLAAVYGGVPLHRAGLRYLNRIAVPRDSELEDWFTIGFAAPPFLVEPYAINLRQTWGRVDGHDDLSATLGLALIEIPEPSLQGTHAGILLDIEVFNLWKPMAPTFVQLPDWCRRAHNVEGDIFESSITDKLRNLFEVVR